MAEISLLDGSMGLGTNGLVQIKPFTVVNSGAEFPVTILHFEHNASSPSMLYGACPVPEEYSSAPQVKVYWTSDTTGGTVRWRFRHYTGAANANVTWDFDTSDIDDEQDFDDGGPTTAWDGMMAPIDLAGSLFGSPGQLMQWDLSLRGPDSVSTGSDAIVFAVGLKFTT